MPIEIFNETWNCHEILCREYSADIAREYHKTAAYQRTSPFFCDHGPHAITIGLSLTLPRFQKTALLLMLSGF